MSQELHLHVHVIPDGVEARLASLEAAVATANEQLVALTGRFDAATTEIARDLQALRDQIANGTVTPEALAGLDALAARLEVLGADPANPIPEPPPQ